MRSRLHVVSSLSLRDYLVSLWKDPVAGLGLRISLLFIALFGILLVFFFWRLPPELPLFYSRPWGTAQLVPTSFLFVLGVGLSLLVILHAVFAALVLNSEPLLSSLLVWTGALVAFLVDVTVLRVFLLVS